MYACWHMAEGHTTTSPVVHVQAAAFAKAQIRTIGNAIKKLSSELYTKDVHFIMELVQVRQFVSTLMENTLR